VRAAIHNHGPEDKKFPSPDSVFKAIQSLDKRIGCCVDVGHTFRLNEDPAAAIRMVSSRLYDVHLKDLAATGEKPPMIPVGRGVMDIPAILKALVDVKFTGHVALEWEDEADNPVPGMAESYGFVRGVFARG
jgi:sugar phosphate isomerase/epimerase